MPDRGDRREASPASDLFNSPRFICGPCADYLGRRDALLHVRRAWHRGSTLGAVVWPTTTTSLCLSAPSASPVHGTVGGLSTVTSVPRRYVRTQMVGAIHARLITAWSAAFIFGPVTSTTCAIQLTMACRARQVYDITRRAVWAARDRFLCTWLGQAGRRSHFMTEMNSESRAQLAT